MVFCDVNDVHDFLDVYVFEGLDDCVICDNTDVCDVLVCLDD